MRGVAALSVIVLGFILIGCAHQRMPIAPETADGLEDAGVIHVYRPSTLGFALGFPVYLDDEKIGSLGARRRMRWVQPAGRCSLQTMGPDLKLSRERVVEVEPGKTYYFRLNPRLGMVAGGGELRRMDEEKGSKRVGKCKTAKYKP